MRSIERKVVGALIVSKDKKVFLVENSNPDAGIYSGYWFIPGGGIEEGETEEKAIIREVREETGLDISKYKLKLITQDRKACSEKVLKTGERVLCNMIIIDFLIEMGDKDSGEMEIKISEEHTNFGWFDRNQLKNLRLSPPTNELLIEEGYL